MTRTAAVVLCALVMSAGCTTTPPALPSVTDSRSSVAGGGEQMTISAVVHAGNFEIVAVQLDRTWRNIVVNQGTGVIPSGKRLLNPLSAFVERDAASGRHRWDVPGNEMSRFRVNDTVTIWYQWAITYKVPGGNDTAVAFSDIFRTGNAPERGDGERPDPVVTVPPAADTE